MTKISIVCVAFAALLVLPGCRSSADKAKARDEERAAQATELKASIPADSPLAKLELGMSEAEVASILGAPSSQDSRITGPRGPRR